jgi:DNA-binding transcriptional LysR family regulator
MNKFQGMQSFVAVVDAGSFVGAAQVLDTSKAAGLRACQKDTEQALRHFERIAR